MVFHHVDAVGLSGNRSFHFAFFFYKFVVFFRIIKDGNESRTIFNGHQPMEDMKYTRSNHFASGNNTILIKICKEVLPYTNTLFFFVRSNPSLVCYYQKNSLLMCFQVIVLKRPVTHLRQ